MPTPAEDARGRELGKYQLLTMIGRGGMANVHLAVSRGPGGFSKLLVIKVLKPELASDPDFLSMFLDEARVAARLNHPNVVQTYEIGHEGDTQFLAMEYLDGQPLHAIVRRARDAGGLPRAMALRIVSEMLVGLHHAHELTDFDGQPLKIVHRDISPHNVFVTYDGQVKLMDFGIAKAMDSIVETRVGTFKGRIVYASPEQAQGEDVDRRADIFASGVLLYECLTGESFWGKLPDATVASRLTRGEIPKLSDSWPEAPPELERICTKATAYDRSARYESALAMAQDIEAVLETMADVPSNRQMGKLVARAFEEERASLRATIKDGLRGLHRQHSTAPHDPTPTFNDMLPTSVSGVTTGSQSSVKRSPALPPKTAEPAPDDAPKGASKAPWVAAAVFGIAALVLMARAFWPESGGDEGTSEGPAASADGHEERPMATGCDSTDKPVVTLSGEIDSDATLSCDRDYALQYNVFVRPGATLTIEAGTTILGDVATRGTLVVQPGARIVAEGNADRPIVFTSSKPLHDRRPGDWGGLLVLGRATVNLRDINGEPIAPMVEGIAGERDGRYGGDDDDDDSGVLSYVRIEYSGTELAPNNESNGLTLAGVGRRTRLDHVMVRHTADDCFEFFGGTVDGHHLICDSPGDDGFDWDLGYRGRLQFLVVVDDPTVSDESNGFEGDNDPLAAGHEPRSAPTIFNATLCGNGRPSDRESFGILTRRATQGALHDLIVTRFRQGIDPRDEVEIQLSHALFGGNLADDLGASESGDQGPNRDDDFGFDEVAWMAAPERHVRREPPPIDCDHPADGALRPAEALGEGALAPPDDGFFDRSATFLGAFRDESDDWDGGAWVVWGN